MCCAVVAWLTGCGGTLIDEARKEVTVDAEATTPPPPPEPEFAGCSGLEVGYLSDADQVDVEVRNHALEVVVDGDALTITDTLTVVARAQAKAMLLQLSPSLEIVQAFRVEAGETAGIAVSCQTGDQHGSPLIRLGFDTPLAPGQEIRVLVRSRPASTALKLATPRTEPLLIDRNGQVTAASTYLSGDVWYPTLLEPGPLEATLQVVVPAGQTAVASGRPAASGPAHTEVVPAPRRPVPLGVVVGPSAMVHATDLPRAGGSTRVVFLASEKSTAPDDTLALFADMVGYLETALGAWPWGTIALAEVLPEHGEALAATLGLVIMSPSALQDPQQGASFLFDLLTRQWLESKAAIEQRLLEGVIQYLSIRYAARAKGPNAGDPLAPFADLRAKYLAGGGKDVPIAKLGLVDPMFVPIAYGKVGSVLQTLHETLGDEVFHAGLRSFVADGAASSDDAPLGVEALQKAMEEAAGRSLASWFDFYFRSTGPLRVTAQCNAGKTRFRQKGSNVTPLQFDAVVGGKAVSVTFDESDTVVVDAPCDRKAEVVIPHALVVVVK